VRLVEQFGGGNFYGFGFDQAVRIFRGKEINARVDYCLTIRKHEVSQGI